MAKDRKVDVVIGAKDEASRVFSNAQKNIASFSIAVTGINQALEIGSKIARSAKQAYDFAEVGASFAKTSFAFNQMSKAVGADAAATLTEIRTLTGGTVSDFDLMKKAAKATTLGIPIDKVGKFAEIARVAAAAMGESTDFMFNSIVTGTARQSRLILDNLGIIISEEKVYRAETERLGHALSDVEKKQAFMNAVIVSGQKIIEDIGDVSGLASEQFGRFEATLSNARDRVAEIVGQAFGNVLADWAVQIEQFTDSAEFEEILVNLAKVLELSAQAATIVPAVLLGMKDFFAELVSSGDIVAANIAVIVGGIDRMAENARRVAEELEGFIGPMPDPEIVQEIVDTNVDIVTEGLDDQAEAYEQAGMTASEIIRKNALAIMKFQRDLLKKEVEDRENAEFEKALAVQQATDMMMGYVNKYQDMLIDGMLQGQIDLQNIFRNMAGDFLKLFIDQILKDTKLALVAKLISMLKLFDVRANDLMAIQMGRDYARLFQQGVFEGMDFGSLAGGMARGALPPGGGAMQIGAAVPAAGITININTVIGEEGWVKDNLIPIIEDSITNKETVTLGADEWPT